MYTVEYYKTRKGKPDTRGYSEWKEDVIDKTWNIKSVTIDFEDIKHILLEDFFSYHLYHKSTKYLLNMIIRFRRQWNTISSAQKIQILNTNYTNTLYIYSILNCEWMVNKDEEIDVVDVLKVVREYFTYIELYNKETDMLRKEKLKKKIDLKKYHLDTLVSLKEEKQEQEEINEGMTLRLGTHFLKNKTNK